MLSSFKPLYASVRILSQFPSWTQCECNVCHCRSRCLCDILIVKHKKHCQGAEHTVFRFIYKPHCQATMVTSCLWCSGWWWKYYTNVRWFGTTKYSLRVALVQQAEGFSLREIVLKGKNAPRATCIFVFIINLNVRRRLFCNEILEFDFFHWFHTLPTMPFYSLIDVPEAFRYSLH